MRTTSIGLVSALALVLGAATYVGIVGCELEPKAGAAPAAQKGLPAAAAAPVTASHSATAHRRASAPDAAPAHRSAPGALAPAARPATATATSMSVPEGVGTSPVRADVIEISHVIAGGRIYDGQLIAGTDAFTLRRGSGDIVDATRVGSIERKQLDQLLQRALDAGVLQSGQHGTPSPSPELTEYFTIASGGVRASYASRPGALPEQVQKVIAAYELLFLCGDGDGDALTCGAGFACGAGACVPADESCFCGAQYDPVCGADGQSYGNACRASCAGVEVTGSGECTALGAMCGGTAGFSCDPGQKCRYGASSWHPSYPDAAGQCVAQTYCDTSADCAVLPAPSEAGTYVCQDSACEYMTAAR